MKANGSTIKSITMPVMSTTTLKRRPRSDWKVISPNPSVLITVSVQYSPVIHECSFPSYSMMKWKSTVKTAITMMSAAT